MRSLMDEESSCNTFLLNLRVLPSPLRITCPEVFCQGLYQPSAAVLYLAPCPGSM